MILLNWLKTDAGEKEIIKFGKDIAQNQKAIYVDYDLYPEEGVIRYLFIKSATGDRYVWAVTFKDVQMFSKLFSKDTDKGVD